MSPFKQQRTPTWEEMSFIKDLFWEPGEAVVQFHPPELLHVNNHRYVLHLWRPTRAPLPLPPWEMVGVLGMGPEEAEREARDGLGGGN